MDTEPQEEVEPAVEQMDSVMENMEQAQEQVEQEVEKSVPLSALQKERKKRQEAELQRQRNEVELEFLKKQLSPKEVEQDEDDLYDSATKKDLRSFDQKTQEKLLSAKAEIMRDVQEGMWTKENPDKAEWVLENLEEFLTKRPQYRDAIGASSNRHQEAYELMQAFTPRKEVQARQAQKPSPHSPSSVPKGASLNQSINVMKMTDAEFNQWRSEQQRKSRTSRY